MDNVFDSNIPIPDVKPGRKPRYQWGAMKVGQSLWVEGGPAGKAALVSAQGWARRRLATVWRNPDGSRGVASDELRTMQELFDYVKDREGQWMPVGRWAFTGRQENGGWRIWRMENTPFGPDDWIEVDGIRVLKLPAPEI